MREDYIDLSEVAGLRRPFADEIIEPRALASIRQRARIYSDVPCVVVESTSRTLLAGEEWIRITEARGRIRAVWVELGPRELEVGLERFRALRAGSPLRGVSVNDALAIAYELADAGELGPRELEVGLEPERTRAGGKAVVFRGTGKVRGRPRRPAPESEGKA